MALVAHRPFQPAVDTAPPSPTSSTSTTALAPRPLVLAAPGIWKPMPPLTEKDSYFEPAPASAPVPSKALATIPRPSPTPISTSTSPPTKLLPAPIPAIPSPTAATTTPRSILKSGDIHPANRPAGYSPTAPTSSSSSSLNSTSKAKAKQRRSRGKSIKEGAFYAFVLLPLSCWYTRGGKRLGYTDAPVPGSSGKGAVGGRKGEMVEWGGVGADEEEDEDERRVRISSTQEMRRSLHGRKDSWSQAGSGGVKSNVVGRRQSFSASVPPGMVVGAGGHGRSNSFSTARGSGSGPVFGAPRREILDYGVDRGPAAVDGGDADRDVEFDRMRLSRQKSRTGSPVPLRRRRSEV
ncbi:hypothetical protein VTL71DRAFT_8017 [Oculimacula yallundae]|uniref:Uncharacterized protein n=1 Tax=Oculimacula yallundae TaxID=86028 RepID=A0ABR4CYU6_9HELO